MRTHFVLSIFALSGLIFQFDCAKHGTGGSDNTGNGNGNTTTPNNGGPLLSSWITRGDRTALLQKQSDQTFAKAANNYPTIDVDSTQQFQSIDGFGYALTDGSAFLINTLPAADRSALLQELFGTGDNSISVSYLRISIGASDLNASVYSYDDVSTGQTDETLSHFSLSPDATDLIPVLKQILGINPGIKILASPWSPPVWMKDNGNSVGGSLLTQYYDAYARYFVKYIQQMQANGITINAITPQNEPLFGGNNPSMVMTSAQEASFIKNNLGPAFQAASISTKIIVYDHNCDRPDYPIDILNDVGARPFVDGSAFHLYAGDISALSTVHSAYPDKNLYFTEQWTGSKESFDGNLKWHLKNVIIGTVRNWGRVALEWNLANDPNNNPHTAGGCTECQGAVTIAGSSVTRNVSYYIVAHAAKFVPPGSVRIASNIVGDLSNVAFRTPAGKKVLIVENDGTGASTFNIRFNGQWTTSTLAGAAVGTYVW
jgi:glucosylceramidase